MADRVGQQLGNYLLVRRLGQGAFAEVYLGEHQYLEIPAAIKVLHVHIGPETHEQFRREAHIIAHLQHPHILHILDFGIADQTPYLVMTYASNGTLRTQHPKGTRLPLEQIVTYVKQLAQALDYAHQQRVIHRDVKPENMLLNAHHEVVLSDFGIAVVQQTIESLSPQNTAGTPLYMAPEQWQGKPCAASDQYALAVVVYEWLCGEPPFHGSLVELYSQHLYEPPPGLCVQVPQLPPIVEDAVLGALAKDPQQRFTSVQDFASVLEAACSATQPLLSRVHTEQESQDQRTPLVILSAPMAALIARQEDLSDEATQPRLLALQHIRDEQEPVRLAAAFPAVQGQSVPRRAKLSVAQTNRQRLLRKVHSFWIAGVLEHSLHGAFLIALGLAQQPDAVATPWQLVLHHTAALVPLRAGTHIKEVYDAAEGELLILGAPGSGKTTLLLELTRDLLERAEHDEQHPLPVVFNLSSWATKQQRLTDWLVEELNTTYQVPHTLGQAWVGSDQILPLLDGLDELAPLDRTLCVETINIYRQEHGLLPLVVCSRSADYLAQTARLRLGSAVMVQPLTQQQVDDYLAHGGEPLRALRVALGRDTALRELTSSPLMLSILTLTYHGMAVEDLVQGASSIERQRQVFEHYVGRMLRQRGTEMRYMSEQTTHWLSWLARQMKQQNQSIFYIESMQPDWLPKGRSRQLYESIAVILLPGLPLGLLFGTYSWLNAPKSGGRFFGLLVGLLAWLLFGLISGGGQEREPLPNVDWSWARRWRSLGKGLLVGLGCGLVAGLRFGLLNGLNIGLTGGVFAGFLFELIGEPETQIKPVEVIVWSWARAWQNLRQGLLFGLVGGLVVVLGLMLLGILSLWLLYLLHYKLNVGFLTSGLVGQLTFFGLVIWLFYGMVYGLAGGLFGGLSSKMLEARRRITPNQGIWRSVANSVRIGLIGGVCVGLIYGLVIGLLIGLIYGIQFGLSRGLLVGLFLGLLNGLIYALGAILAFGLRGGGLAWMKHVVLRLLLWRTKSVPWNYPRFLDYCTERILLCKVGGGYIFVHRLVLEYFSSLDSTPRLHEIKAQK